MIFTVWSLPKARPSRGSHPNAELSPKSSALSPDLPYKRQNQTGLSLSSTLGKNIGQATKLSNPLKSLTP